MEKEQTASSEATLNPYAVDSDNPMDWAKAFLAAAARDSGQISGEWAELEAAQWFAAAMLRTIETEYKIRKELDRKSPLQEVAATAWHLLPVNRYGCFVLFGEEAECITGVQDRLGDGHALFVFDRIWPIGEKVWDTEVGYIDEEGQEQKSNDCGRFLVTGYSTHEAAKQIAAKTLGAGLPLMSGFWHEVVSD